MPTVALHQFTADIEAESRPGDVVIVYVTRAHKALEQP